MRLRRSSASKAAGILLKPLKKSQNSLTLKQCHFVGQSSILFSKYIYESFQGLYNQTGYVFLSLIRGSYSDGEPDDGAPPRNADSGCAASQRTSNALTPRLMIRMSYIKNIPSDHTSLGEIFRSTWRIKDYFASKNGTV